MLTPADFTGYYGIAQDPAVQENLESYIEKYEKRYLIDLLGYDLYVLFLASFAGDPSLPTGVYLTIYNELAWEITECERSSDCCIDPMDIRYIPLLSDGTGAKKLSEGILKMLKGFIYFEFIKEYGIEVSQTGLAVNKNENSENLPAGRQNGMAEDRYNDSLTSYKVIRAYLIDHPVEYPLFDGIKKETTHWGGAF